MGVSYNGEHSICFWKKTLQYDGYNLDNPTFTWDMFHLIPQSRPSVSIPKPNYTIVTIPNSSKRVNITEFLPGGMTFESRVGEWLFYIDHNQWPDWTRSHYELEQYFNGSKMLVSLDDDSDDIYEGRIHLSNYEAGENYSQVTIAYDLDADPISDYTGIYFRVRFLGYGGEILQEDLLSHNEIPYYRYLPTYNWSPALDRTTRNVDYKAILR